MRKRIGERTLLFRSEPRVRSAAAIVAKNEGDGAFSGRYDTVLEDDKFGEASFEKAECRMFRTAAMLACQKAGLDLSGIHAMLAGDLLNQLITANYAARDLGIPFLGLYGACSTMAESLLLGGVLSDGGYCSPVLCCASSHFSTAERQYRFPLEMGTTAPPTAQRTVTGAGALLLSTQDVPLPVFSHVALTAATIGRVVDLGITDMNNMGAAMAPACCDTILAHLNDTGSDLADYDLVVSGDRRNPAVDRHVAREVEPDRAATRANEGIRRRAACAWAAARLIRLAHTAVGFGWIGDIVAVAAAIDAAGLSAS